MAPATPQTSWGNATACDPPDFVPIQSPSHSLVPTTPHSIIIDGQKYVPEHQTVPDLTKSIHSTADHLPKIGNKLASQEASPEPDYNPGLNESQVRILVGTKWHTRAFIMRKVVFEDLIRQLPQQCSQFKILSPTSDWQNIHATFALGDPTFFEKVIQFYEAKANNRGTFPPRTDKFYDAFVNPSTLAGTYAEAHKLGLNELKRQLRDYLAHSVGCEVRLTIADAVYSACPDDVDFRFFYTRNFFKYVWPTETETTEHEYDLINIITDCQPRTPKLLTDLLTSSLSKLAQARINSRFVTKELPTRQEDLKYETWDSPQNFTAAYGGDDFDDPLNPESVDDAPNGDNISIVKNLCEIENKSSETLGANMDEAPATYKPKLYSLEASEGDRHVTIDKLDLIISKLENLSTRVNHFEIHD